MAAVALEQLATWRVRGTRASEQVVQQGIIVLENDGLKKIGDDGVSEASASTCLVFSLHGSSLVAWGFLEQLALASMDIGRLDIADVRNRTSRV